MTEKSDLKINSKDFRVPPDKKVDLGKWPTVVDPYCKSKQEYKELLHQHMEKLSALQRLHYASHRYALLLIFQGMDGAGKDGAIPIVLTPSLRQRNGAQWPKLSPSTMNSVRTAASWKC